MKSALLKLLLLYAVICIAVLWTVRAFSPEYSSSPALEAWVLDVGQGESVLVREPGGKKMLFDGGPNDRVLSELGDLLSPWDRTIDLIVLSHNHTDHLRGLLAVLDRYEVSEIWISGATHTSADFAAWQEKLAARTRPPKIVSAPLTEAFGEAILTIHHPTESMAGKSPSHQHDANLVVEVSYGSQDLLLTGDLEEWNERSMLVACKLPSCELEAEVLQVPHHGSAGGLREDFLEAVDPLVAVIPVGLDNRFDHPRAVILDRLKTAQVPVYRTDTQGRIHILLSKERVTVQPIGADAAAFARQLGL